MQTRWRTVRDPKLMPDHIARLRKLAGVVRDAEGIITLEAQYEQRVLKLPTSWRRAMHQSLFQPCAVEYGDKKVRGVSLICGKCGSVGRVPMNHVNSSGGNDDREVELVAMRKFSRMGWVIGKQPSRHRCPTCEAQTKPFAAALAPIKQQKEEPKMPTNGAVPHEPAQVEQPPEMTRDDRRVIFAKLNEVYDNAQTGYSRDWSDKRVAEDLGVPRAWIATVRDENFGPDHNAEFVEQIAFAKAACADFKMLHDAVLALRDKQAGEISNIMGRIKPMLTVMEKVERSIAAIEKAMVQ